MLCSYKRNHTYRLVRYQIYHQIQSVYKYLNKNASGAQDSFESIRRAKEDERLEKKDRIKIYIEEALKNADIYAPEEVNELARASIGYIESDVMDIKKFIYKMMKITI